MKRRSILAVIAVPALSSCLVLPYVSRTETITRFQVIPIADLENQRTVYLVNRCADRSDLREECSEYGNHGQFLTIQMRGWKLERNFSPAKEDLTLSTYYANRYGFFVPPESRDLGSNDILLGDFVKLKWGVYERTALRVWLRTTPSMSSFHAEPLAPVPSEDGRGVLKVWPMNPTLVCRRTVKEYLVDTMFVIPQTGESHEFGRSDEESCAASQ